jgi:hypothetical protein
MRRSLGSPPARVNDKFGDSIWGHRGDDDDVDVRGLVQLAAQCEYDVLMLEATSSGVLAGSSERNLELKSKGVAIL